MRDEAADSLECLEASSIIPEVATEQVLNPHFNRI